MVKIQLTDVNDNQPTFYPPQYNVSLREQHMSPSPVVVVVATDRDSGVYGQVGFQTNYVLEFKTNNTNTNNNNTVLAPLKTRGLSER